MRLAYALATIAWIVGAWPVVIGTSARAEESVPKQPDELKVTATLTHGNNGPPRAATGIICDIFGAHLTIEGLQRNSEGKVDFSIRTKVLDKDGLPILDHPWTRKSFAAGPRVVHQSVHAQVATKLDPEKAGSWIWRNEIEDHVSGQKSVSETTFETVMPAGIATFGIHYGRDQNCQGSAGASFAEGEVIYLNAGVVNFAVKDGQARLHAKVRVLDTKGEPMDWPEIEFSSAKEISQYDVDPRLPFLGRLNAVRQGKYIVEIHLVDLIGGTSSTDYLPLLVTENPDWTLDATQIARLKADAEDKSKSR